MALLPDTSTSSLGETLAGADLQPNTTYRMQIEEERIQGALSERLAAVEQAAYKGIADKMKSVRLAQIFSSERGGKPDAEWCSVEDFPPKCGQKRCVKMARLNLSVLPKILNTERYEYVIYSWNYGVELADLFGKPIPYVLSEIPRRVREALVQDDRIRDVTDFDIRYVRDNAQGRRGDVLACFRVQSIYGDIAMEKGVRI
ncbi:DUF2634 domain-containing protein [uncultured Selenomonas sp.]|uniref:DUF2634 domain-containing protein n=1 Tax=uncultured Selenomonas sp. TaxID=159275 RepID=UPI0028EF0572|nr:DUF2634 domain-containing protein [uncultured Selenomonas sp.]